MCKAFIFLTILCCVGAYKILVVFPYPGKSHTILGDGFVRHLLKAGHQVTYITGILIKNPHENLRQIDVSKNFEVFEEFSNLLNLENKINNGNKLEDLNTLFGFFRIMANSTLTNKNLQHFIHDPKEHFDVVIAEWLYTELYSGFSVVFDAPLIWSSSMEPHTAVMSLIHEDLNPAYNSIHLSHAIPPFTFAQRLKELGTLMYMKFLKWWLYDLDNELFRAGFADAVAKRGRNLPSLHEVQYSGALMFGNSYVSSGQAVQLPQNYKAIAGYHIDDEIKKLPENLQKIMDNAEHGVIYFSLGSLVKSKSMSNDMKRGLLNMFGKLKQTVIWKFEELLPNLPKNVHILEWAPQQSILAHKNCIIFITHGGLLSTTEALHFGVPLIGIPIFADQHINIFRAVNKGFAKEVPLNNHIVKNLKEAVDEVLGNPKYKEKVKELSFIHHDRPVSPGAELVHWVEHVVRTRGAPHLRSPALDVPFYQKWYLDLLVLLIGLILVVKIVLLKLFRVMFKRSDFKVKVN